MDSARKRTLYDWILEILTLLCLVWAFLPLFCYGNLSAGAEVPIHYNMHGVVNDWGSRVYLWFVPSIAFVFYISFFIVEIYHKKLINYPVKVTADNADVVRRVGVRFLRYLKLFIVFVFAYISNSTFAIAMGEKTALNKSFVYALIAVLFVILLIFFLKVRWAALAKENK